MTMYAIHFAGPPFTVNFFNAQLLYIQKIITSIQFTEIFSILRKLNKVKFNSCKIQLIIIYYN